MSYASMVKESIQRYPELKIIDAQKVYNAKFKQISELSFYKVLSRMTDSGEISRISKGIYCKPRKGRFGMVTSGENDVLEHLLGAKKNKGVVIGYQMYIRYGLTTQVAKTIEIYSNSLVQEKRKIGSIMAHKAIIAFDTDTIRMVELLEVLQDYRKIEDLNRTRLMEYLEDAIGYYNEQNLGKIIKAIGYKKCTLASLKNVLDYFGVNNTVGNYLNGTSRYKSIDMEELYEFALER